MILSIKDSLQQQILLMATSLGTNAVVVMRVHCNNFYISEVLGG